MLVARQEELERAKETLTQNLDQMRSAMEQSAAMAAEQQRKSQQVAQVEFQEMRASHQRALRDLETQLTAEKSQRQLCEAQLVAAHQQHAQALAKATQVLPPVQGQDMAERFKVNSELTAQAAAHREALSKLSSQYRAETNVLQTALQDITRQLEQARRDSAVCAPSFDCGKGWFSSSSSSSFGL